MKIKSPKIIIPLIVIIFLMIPGAISGWQREQEAREQERNSLDIDIDSDLKEQMWDEYISEYESYFESHSILVSHDDKTITVRLMCDDATLGELDTEVMNSIYNGLYDIVFEDNFKRYGEFFLNISYWCRFNVSISFFEITKDKSQIRLIDYYGRRLTELLEACPDISILFARRVYESLDEYSGFKNLKKVYHGQISKEEKEYILKLFPECEFAQIEGVWPY